MAATCALVSGQSVCPAPYRPRNPRTTSLYQLVDHHYETVKGLWEERFEQRYGFWRGFYDTAVARYLDCGLFESGLRSLSFGQARRSLAEAAGFARVRCTSCPNEFLVAFSCKGRGLCPSCGAKRAAIFSELLQHQILADVPHAQWVFSIPKMLRRYFLHHRELLGEMARLAYETVREMMAAEVDEPDARLGMVGVIQTFSSSLRWNPHIHSIASRGVWTPGGEWMPVPYVDEHRAERLFRHKLLTLLRDRGLISQECIDLLLSWRHSGFSVHNRTTVYPSDTEGLHKLACYLMRAPVNLSRLRFDHDSGLLLYQPKPGHELDDDALTDPLEFLARVLIHVLRWDALRRSPATSHSFEAARMRTIPEPNKHLVHFYGVYANRVRRAYREQLPPKDEAKPNLSRRAANKRWAELIYHIYEVDPLTCNRCGGEMKILAFITDPSVIRTILDHRDQTAAVPRAPPKLSSL